MTNAVYHRFTPNDRFETKVMTWPSIIWSSGAGGLNGNLDSPSGSLSLYGGPRGRNLDVVSSQGPLIADDPSIVSHVYFVNNSLVDTKGNTWAGSVSINPTSSLGFPSGMTAQSAGPFSIANHYTISSPDVFDLSSTSSFIITAIASFTGAAGSAGAIYDTGFMNAGQSGSMLQEGPDGPNYTFVMNFAGSTVYFTNPDPGAHFLSGVPFVVSMGWDAVAQNMWCCIDNRVPTFIHRGGAVVLPGLDAATTIGINTALGSTYSWAGQIYEIAARVAVPSSASISAIHYQAIHSTPTPTTLRPFDIYPLDDVDTHSIDKVIQISGSYPATGTINLVRMTNTQPTSYITDVTDTRWYDTHYHAIELLYGFHNQYNTAYEFSTASYPDIRLFHVPSMYYDRQMATGTIRITDYSVSGSRVFIDDGYGQLLLSGTNQQWGAVFYVEGLITITPPAVSSSYVIGAGAFSASDGRKVELSFSGSHPIITKTFMCRIHESECNCSLNPTWSVDVSGTRKRAGDSNTTYISSVGLYNEDFELVAVAKLAQPIRKREQDRLDIRLRMDF